MIKQVFQEGNRVELISDSYQDGGLCRGMIGTVMKVKQYTISQVKETDVLVDWGDHASWVDGNDLSIN